MRAVVIFNQSSGSGGEISPVDLVALFKAAGVQAELVEAGATELTESARRAAQSGADVVVAAGGDGTVNAVATALVGTPVPLGVLPTGTLNHFARDMAIPFGISAAVRVIAAGHVKTVDVGEVNGRVFVNNSSIGFYPRIVKHRDRLRMRLVPSKWLAMFYAVLSVFRRYPQLDVELGVNGNTVHRSTPFVFVGNNCYELDLTAMGARRSLCDGVLCLYVAHRPGRMGLILLAVLALFRRLKQARDFDELKLKDVTINTPKRRLAVAVDGEVQYMTPPLRYRIRPRELNVLVARDT